MDSIGPECTDLKKKYEKCFNKWFSEEFLTRKNSDDIPCRELFDEYQKCVVNTIKDKKLDTVLSEARAKNSAKSAPNS